MCGNNRNIQHSHLLEVGNGAGAGSGLVFRLGSGGGGLEPLYRGAGGGAFFAAAAFVPFVVLDADVL